MHRAPLIERFLLDEWESTKASRPPPGSSISQSVSYHGTTSVSEGFVSGHDFSHADNADGLNRALVSAGSLLTRNES
jgi:hypothetical protein